MKRIGNFIWFLINLIVAIATVFSGYGGMVDPEKHTLPSIAALTFPIWLLITALLFIINLWKAKRFCAIPLVSILICWEPITRFCPLHRAKESDKTSLKVMTYNVLSLQDYRNQPATPPENPTLRYIIDAAPDIIALQESPSYTSAGGLPVSRSVADSLYSLYPYRKCGGEGQSLLSRYPFKEIKLHYPTTHGFQVRAYSIDSPLGNLTLFNVHLKSIGLTDDDKELYRQFTDGSAARQPIKQELKEFREDVISKLSAAFRERALQSAKVKEMVDSIGGTIIVCGDFNDIQGCYACREIESSGLKDAYSTSGFGPAISYHANRFFFRIDHILYSSQLTPLWTRVESNPTSDHYPVISSFISSDPE